MILGEALDTKIVANTHDELLKKLNIKLTFSFEDTINECIKYTKTLDQNYLKKVYEFFKT